MYSKLNNCTFNILGPCLTDEEISVFEQSHNITLPLQYKVFLSQIGNGLKFKNGNIINGIRFSKNRHLYNRLSYRFLFKDEINAYKKLLPKPYPRYDGIHPQYKDCLDTLTYEEQCKICPHFFECIDTEYDESTLYNPQNNAYFNGCLELSNRNHFLIVTGDSKGQVWHTPEADSGIMIPKFKDFNDFLIAFVDFN